MTRGARDQARAGARGRRSRDDRGGTLTALRLTMIASHPATSMSSSAQPQSIDALVGSALELVIHSVETVRDRILRVAMRRTRR